MKANQIDKILEYVESKGLIEELEDFLKPKPKAPEAPRFTSIKTLLGATGGNRGDSEILKAKFVAFMEKAVGGTVETEGVHIDKIVTAQRGVEKKKDDAGKLLPDWKASSNNTRNWLENRMKDTNKSKAIVGMVEGKEAYYYYIPAKAEKGKAAAGTGNAKKALAAA